MVLHYLVQCFNIHYVYIFYESWKNLCTLNSRKNDAMEPLNVSTVPHKHDNVNVFSYKNCWLVEALFVGLRKARVENEALCDTIEKLCQLWNTYIHYILNDQATSRFGIIRACHMICLRLNQCGLTLLGTSIAWTGWLLLKGEKTLKLHISDSNFPLQNFHCVTATWKWNYILICTYER